MFCGGGGSSLGASMAGVKIVGGAEMAEYPARAFEANFPAAKLYKGDLRILDLNRLRHDLGRINLLLASPECTNHTCAKGSAPRSEESKETALQVIRFATALQPDWIVLENVVHMRPWKRYPEMKESLSAIGYTIAEVVLDSSLFGVPQKRRRLFMIAGLTKQARAVVGRTRVPKTAASVLDPDGSWPTTYLFLKGRAKGTLERAERAIAEVGTKTPFLLVYYGTDGAGGWQPLDQPLRTVTTIDRFALVEPSRSGHKMRMLQASELRRAMGFPGRYRFPAGTRRDKIKLLGNAVCPPVMRAIIESLT
ncbi:MAG TPA: DNA cytosine methyltransferase [Acidobacteriaceae bacterium]